MSYKQHNEAKVQDCSKPLPTIGGVEPVDTGFADLIDSDAPIEVIATGFSWTEGPAWDVQRDQLYFSDIPENRIYVWNSISDLSIFLEPGGRENPGGNEFAMPGTNGLFMSDDDTLLICNQDARSVDRLHLRNMSRTVVAANLEGAAFNSPNDVISSSSGYVYFTDPPFGLKQREPYVGMELDFHGVYRVNLDDRVHADVQDMSFPNGLVFTPDEQYLYVSQSDKKSQIIKKFAVKSDGSLGAGRVFFDAIAFSVAGSPGLPDGMTVDAKGNLFATVAGGVAVISSVGTLLGRIATGKATANCTFGEDGHSLFITAHDTLLRVRTKTRGLGFEECRAKKNS